MRIVSASEVRSAVAEVLGLVPRVFEEPSTVLLACVLRRAASFLCPSTARALVDAVVESLRGLVQSERLDTSRIGAVLESLVSYGDLHEACDVSRDDVPARAALIYAAPPSFVPRASGGALLLGVAPDGVSSLPEQLAAQVEYVGHTRRLVSDTSDALQSLLVDLGLIRLSEERWLKAPAAESAEEQMTRLNRKLDRAPFSGEVAGLTILDPSSSVRYYRGRWRKPQYESGRFVARRSQAYGAALWCYVELDCGQPRKLLDLPLEPSRWRGCDEAWRLQAAIDATRGEPQQIRVRDMGNDTTALELFSPIPSWAARRWSALGIPLDSTGCLQAWAFAAQDAAEEIGFAGDRLWLASTVD